MASAITNMTNSQLYFHPLIPSVVTNLSDKATEDFETLTEYLDPLKKASVLEKIRTLQNKEKIISKVVELANLRCYSSFSDIFLSREFEYYALAAVQEKDLSSLKFGSLMFVRSALSKDVKIQDLQIVPLFDKGAPSNQAWNNIFATMKSDAWINLYPSMDSHDLAQFFEIMRTQPVSEQSFVLIPDTRDPSSGITDISKALNRNVAFNVFCGLEINGKRMRMIPSLGMVEAMIGATGTDGFKFKIRLGDSPVDKLWSSMLNDDARDLCIHCDEISPVPDIADDHPVIVPFNFTYHDIYHIWVCRHVVKNLRRFLCQVASFAHPDQFVSLAAKNAAWDLYVTLVDMDIESFRPETNLKNINVEKASDRAIKDIFNITLPARKKYLKPKYQLSLVEQKESNSVADELKEKVSGLYAIWKLYKKNYSQFEEITDMYQQLSPEVQKSIGEDYFLLQKYIECCSHPPFSREDLSSFQPHELSQLLELTEVQFSLMTLVSEGIPFKAIWKLTPNKRLLIASRYFEVLQLFDIGILFDSITKLDFDLLEFILSDNNYIHVRNLHKKNIDLNKITDLISKILELKIPEKFSMLDNLINSETALDYFVKADPASLVLIFNNCFFTTDLVETIMPFEKLLKLSYTQLEYLFNYMSEHRFDSVSHEFINASEMMQRDPEFQRKIESFLS